MKGLVYKSTGSWYQVKAEDGEVYNCRIKGKFRLKGIKSTNPVAVGDRVKFDLEEGEQVGLSEEFILRLFKAVHQESINHQEKVMKAK